MGKTVTVHARYKSSYISLPFFAKQQRDRTKFCLVYRTWTTTANFVYIYFSNLTLPYIFSFERALTVTDKLNDSRVLWDSQVKYNIIFQVTSSPLSSWLLKFPMEKSAECFISRLKCFEIWDSPIQCDLKCYNNQYFSPLKYFQNAIQS